MFFYSSPHFQRDFQDFFKLLLSVFSVWVQQLDKTVCHFTDSNGIALVEILAEAEIFIQFVSMLLLAQLSNKFGEIIGDKTIVVGKVFRSELRDLPARDIAMDSVKERRVRSHLRRERFKKAGCFKQHIHALIDVAHKDHRSTCRLFFLATGEGTGSHIVLHDLNAVFILEMNSGNLIKSDAIPEPNKPHGFPAHIVEQIRYSCLTAGNKDAVG